jgi:predicted dehydrogenase
MANDRTSRRGFLRLSASSLLAASVAPTTLGSAFDEMASAGRQSVSPSDRIGLATIGMGIIGFINAEAALQLPGVELVAAADLYDGRLVRTREDFGKHIFTTRDYREILARPDVDAVVVATPDHWHRQIAIDAMEAGKAVYLEKPMVHSLEEGPPVIDVQRKTGAVLQVGSQHVSSAVYHQARKLYEEGAIGTLNMIEARNSRNSALGAWQYSLPLDASPETVDWDRFLGSAPYRPFDAERFFRWRNYWDYGTGLAGDLYVHLFTGIHYVLSSTGPISAQARGILSHWKDGRDVPDVMAGLYQYPETSAHPAFLLSLQTNFVDGSTGVPGLRFIGSEGVMSISGGGLTLTSTPMHHENENQIVHGYNSVRTFSREGQEAFARALRERPPAVSAVPRIDRSQEYRAPQGHSSRLEHFKNFFASLRDGAPLVEDAVFGYRAAAPSLLANLSYLNNRIYFWNPENMTLDPEPAPAGAEMC